MKKKLAVLLALSLTMSMAPVTAWGAGTEEPSAETIEAVEAAEETGDIETVEAVPAPVAETYKTLTVGTNTVTCPEDVDDEWFQFTPSASGRYAAYCIDPYGDKIGTDFYVDPDGAWEENLVAGKTYYLLVDYYDNDFEAGDSVTVVIGLKSTLYSDDVRDAIDHIGSIDISLNRNVQLSMKEGERNYYPFGSDLQGFVKFTAAESGRYRLDVAENAENETSGYKCVLIDSDYAVVGEVQWVLEEGTFFDVEAGKTYYLGIQDNDWWGEEGDTVNITLKAMPRVTAVAAESTPRRVYYRGIDSNDNGYSGSYALWLPGMKVKVTYSDGSTEIVEKSFASANGFTKYEEPVRFKLKGVSDTQMPAVGTYTGVISVGDVEQEIGEVTVKNASELSSVIEGTGSAKAVMNDDGYAWVLLKTGSGKSYTIGCSEMDTRVRVFTWNEEAGELNVEGDTKESGSSVTLTPNTLYCLALYEPYYNWNMTFDSDVTVTVSTPKKNIASCKVSLSKTKVTYTGKAIKPKVTVKSGGKKLSTKYYSVSYSDNKKVGQAKVVIKGKSTYGGYLVEYFEIIPKGTSIKKVTPVSKGLKVSWNKRSGVYGYEVQYSTSSSFKNADSVSIADASQTSTTITGLKAKKKYYVRVRVVDTAKYNGGDFFYFSTYSAKKSATTKK